MKRRLSHLALAFRAIRAERRRFLPRQAAQARRRHIVGPGLRPVGAADRPPHRQAHSGPAHAHRREHAGRRPHRRDQSSVQPRAEGRHHHRHGLARHDRRRDHEGAQHPLRARPLQLARQSRGQSPRDVRERGVRHREHRRSVRARADRRRARRRAGRDRGAAAAQEPHRPQAQDRHRLSLARRGGAGGDARRGRQPRHHRGRSGERAPAVGRRRQDARAVQHGARARAMARGADDLRCREDARAACRC